MVSTPDHFVVLGMSLLSCWLPSMCLDVYCTVVLGIHTSGRRLIPWRSYTVRSDATIHSGYHTQLVNGRTNAVF